MKKLFAIMMLFCCGLGMGVFTSCGADTGSGRTKVFTNNTSGNNSGSGYNPQPQPPSNTETPSQPQPILPPSDSLQTNLNYRQLTKCQVTTVSDGDTLYANQGYGCPTERIRLIGVDTPETVNPNKPVQCYGEESSNFTKTLQGQTVYLETDYSQGDTDIYGRPLRYVYTENGENWNMKLILEGYGHEYTYNTAYKYKSQFKSAENTAKAGNKGFWSLFTCGGNTEQSVGGSGDSGGGTVIPPSSSGGSDSPAATGSRGSDYWYGSTHCVKIPNDGDWYKCTRSDGSTYNHTGS